MHPKLSHSRSFQTAAGLACFAAALALVAAGPPAGTAGDAPAAEESAAPADAGSAPPASQTFRATEPPARVGRKYDSDGSLPTRSERIVDYRLKARLAPDARQVTGSGTILWTNASSEPTSELFFHLYLNAFKNDSSLFLRSPFTSSRSGRRPDRWGYIDVTSLTWPVEGDADLWKRAAAHSPDDSRDQTDIRVPLPRPVKPGERIELELSWTSQLPEIVERTGVSGDFFMVGQWFPKLARRTESGRWLHFPFHAYSEFFADYGSYDVTLDVPHPMIVGATGKRIEEHIEGDRRVVRYHADDVHDFAWTAWSGFVEERERLSGVDVRLLRPPGQRKNARATWKALRFGLDFYGRAFGAYPYPTLTVVHPPRHARGAGGMEYPTLITTGGPWYVGWTTRFVERVTLHELAHQWFYGLVATDEHTWPFLDEGLSTYAETLAMDELYGDGSGFAAFGLSVSGTAYLRTLAASAAHRGPIARPAADFQSFGDLGALVYARTGTLLSTLGRVYGKERLLSALGRYARRYRFSHPTPRHLLAVIRQIVGDEAAAAARDALFDGGYVDFVAESLQSVRETTPAGVFDRDGGRTTVRRDANGARDRWISRAVLYRYGTLQFPVDVELITESGNRSRKHWDGRGRSTALLHEGTERVVAVVIDPDRRVVIDQSLSNNATGERHFPIRTLERATYAAELLLHGVGP